ncbi:MAG: hypothetical protein AB2693_17575, partial [Candidatus Thiodiazotropha sp.]
LFFFFPIDKDIGFPINLTFIYLFIFFYRKAEVTDSILLFCPCPWVDFCKPEIFVKNASMKMPTKIKTTFSFNVFIVS